MKILAAPFDEMLGIKRIGANVAKNGFSFLQLCKSSSVLSEFFFSDLQFKIFIPDRKKEKTFSRKYRKWEKIKRFKAGTSFAPT